MQPSENPRRSGAGGFRTRLVRKARSLLTRAVSSSPRFRRVAERTVTELERALLNPNLYGRDYFEPKQAAGGVKASGYADYRRETSNLDVAAYIVFKHLRPERVLDVGTARGFFLEALVELGIDCFGVDISHDAIIGADVSIKPKMLVGAATGLPFRAGSMPIVTLFETLEHLPPRLVPKAIAEIERVCSGFVVATIPSFGPNENGPDGWLNGKVRWEVVDHYASLLPEFEGPVPLYDLMRDQHGNPIEGHLTIASFSWWTKRFAEAGLDRLGSLESGMNEDLGRYGLLGDQIWNLHVFRKPSAQVAGLGPATEEELTLAKSVLRLPVESQDLSNPS